MTTWFTSDHHFGHANIIKYCNRPFSSAEEMDEEMIRRWNEKVDALDLVYYIGDFSLRGGVYRNSIVNRLNGDITFIPGSHDPSPYDEPNWRAKEPMIAIHTKIQEKNLIVLCHYALRSWNRSHYGSWHLFGHHHGRLEPYGLSFDVGVDTNNFYLYSLEDVAEKMKTLSPIVDYSRKREQIGHPRTF